MVSPNEIGGSGGEKSDFFDRWRMLMDKESGVEDVGRIEPDENEVESVLETNEESEDDSDMKIWGEESEDDTEEVIEENGEKVKIHKKGNKINVRMPKSDFVRGWQEARKKKQQEIQDGLNEKPSEETKVVLVEGKQEKVPFFEVGAFGMSAAEVYGEDGEKSEDAFYVNRERGIFGVFDGVGGEVNGGEAAKIAQQILETRSRERQIDLVDVAEEMHKAVYKWSRGITTAVLAKIGENEEGKKELYFASLGDSRLYLFRDGELSQLTTDENVTEEDLDNAKIFNKELREAYLKHGIKNGVGNQEQFRINEKNFGMRKLQSGDRVILCTDGVTGDVEEEKMSPETIVKILEQNSDDSEAAEALVRGAMKKDDRTAIVFSV